MKVLVTGATGVLGNYIIKYLRSANISDIAIITRSNQLPALIADEDLTIFKGDILDIDTVYEATKNIDVVIHAAAEVSFDPKDSSKMFEINIGGTTNIVNACLENNVNRFIHVSSIAAVGRNEKGNVINEDSEWEESKLNTDYAVSKYQAELEVWRGFAEGLNGIIVNPSVILGSGNWNRSSLSMWNKVKEGIPYYPKGSSAIVDVRDVSRFIVKMIDADINHERFIMAGTNLSFKDLFKKMSDVLGVKAPEKELQDWMGEFYWRLELVKSKLSGKRPIVTKETIKTTRSNFIYDDSKSRNVEGFEYIPIDQTMKECGKIYLSGEHKLLPII